MKSKKLANKKIQVSTQQFLDIAQIKEDCVVLKDGTLRAVVLVSSINFSLKSEDEQNAIISAYVGFLNALEFPLQIVIQSRMLDIDSYLAKLEKIEKEQTNDLLRMQTAEYRGYVSQLVKIGDIMTKRFYVVVPYDPLSDQQKTWFRRFTELFTAADAITLSKKQFGKRRKALFQRVDQIVSQLQSMTLTPVILDTQSLIELYYNTYNPKTYNLEKMTEINNLQIEGQ